MLRPKPTWRQFLLLPVGTQIRGFSISEEGLPIIAKAGYNPESEASHSATFSSLMRGG